jgi:hypothetical protein
MKQTLADCDRSIGNLLQMIDRDDYLKNNLNVILTSDRRMHDIPRDQLAKLDDYTDSSLYSQDYVGNETSMHAIFYAFGPAFRRNVLADPFRTVDLYPLMSYVLQLNERPNHGSLENVKDLLVDFAEKHFFRRADALVAMGPTSEAGFGLISETFCS